jgi:CotS family spore coat protein
VVDVEGLNPQILKDFGLKCRSTRKEKGRYVCSTDKGVFIVGKAFAAEEPLLLAHYIKEGLHTAGFADTDRFLTAENGEPFVRFEDGCYTAAAYIKGREARFDDFVQFRQILTKIARMHRITGRPGFYEKFPGKPGVCLEYGEFMPDGGFEKQKSRLRAFKKTVMRQGRLSDFDVMFLKYYDSYERRLNRSMEICAEPGVRDLLTVQQAPRTFAHNSLKEETVLISEGRAFITAFEDGSNDHFLYDLSSVIKRHLRAGSYMDLPEIIEMYCVENPLSKEELKALYAILLLPDKFYKVCIKYYSKKRTWTPGSFDAVMEDISGRGDADEVYVSKYFERYL